MFIRKRVHGYFRHRHQHRPPRLVARLSIVQVIASHSMDARVICSSDSVKGSSWTPWASSTFLRASHMTSQRHRGTSLCRYMTRSIARRRHGDVSATFRIASTQRVDHRRFSRSQTRRRLEPACRRRTFASTLHPIMATPTLRACTVSRCSAHRSKHDREDHPKYVYVYMITTVKSRNHLRCT